MSEQQPSERSALLIIDVQNDFCTGGALAVPGSERVVERLNAYIAGAAARGMPIYASRDWHPATTSHFQPFGGVWPVHCVQDTAGARFHPDLRLPAAAIVISKGDDPSRHGYSALEGHTADGTPFLTDLRRRGINHLYVGGLATDYCVKHSAIDAAGAGLRVTVLEDAIAGVDVQPGDSSRALDAMREQHVDVVAGEGTLAR
jgi:nicotinamidase/pyrazinamidase